jgi:copper chaperone CopZ
MNILKTLTVACALIIGATSISYSQSTETNSVTTTVKVKGISCSTDLKMIKASLEKVDGVNSCEAGKKGTTTSFIVKYDTKLVDERAIYAAIESTGSCENPNERPYKVKQ